MSRAVAVPRGNEWVQFAPLPLDSTSPYWSLLTSDEQCVALETATVRPVMTLVMAEKTILECLIDLRLARSVQDWRRLFARLERVKGVFFQSFNDEAIRESFLVPLRVRFILLGAGRDEAERIAPELIDAVIRLRNAGRWSPPAARPPLGDDPYADIREFYLDQREFDAFQRQWDADATAIQSSQKGWSKPYLDDELRAFPNDPPPDLFQNARGPRIDRFTFAQPPVSTALCPTGFTREAVDHATRHVQELLFFASRLLHPHSQSDPSSDVPLFMAKRFDQLGQRLRTNWASPELRERMVRIRRTNFEVGGVVGLSVHEAVEELARQVWFAVRSAVGHAVDPGGKELDRMTFGPFQWHEMARAIPRLREVATVLISALDSVGHQRLECELRREAAELSDLVVQVEPRPGTQSDEVKDEGEKPKPAEATNEAPVGQSKTRIPRAEAERRVAAAIANTPPDQRHKLTIRALNRATDVSIGMFERLDSWNKLKDEKAGSVRSVPLTDDIHAVLNDPSTDAIDPVEAAAEAEVLSELLELAQTDDVRTRYIEMTPGERWQTLELLKEQIADDRRDQRRPRRERPDRS